MEESTAIPSDQSDKFEENFKELKKWVDIKSPKYCMLLVVRERRSGRLGIALKVFSVSFISHRMCAFSNFVGICLFQILLGMLSFMTIKFGFFFSISLEPCFKFWPILIYIDNVNGLGFMVPDTRPVNGLDLGLYPTQTRPVRRFG